MIYKVTGTILVKESNYVVIETSSGVAYEIGVSLTTYAELGTTGQNAGLYTYLDVREDGMFLFGFSTLSEKKVFMHLISVSGIGPKMGLKILSGIGIESLKSAIASKDYVLISKVPGIGKKTAERIVVELKDKFDDQEVVSAGETSSTSAVLEQVSSALANLGYSAADIKKILPKVEPKDDFNKAIKSALQLISGK